MYTHLLPGGKIILKIEIVNSAPKNPDITPRSSIKRKDGSKITLTLVSSYDEETQIFRSLCRYDSINEDVVTATEREDFLQYLFQFNEIEEMLSAAGFKKFKRYADHLKNETSKTAPIFIYEAIK